MLLSLTGSFLTARSGSRKGKGEGGEGGEADKGTRVKEVG